MIVPQRKHRFAEWVRLEKRSYLRHRMKHMGYERQPYFFQVRNLKRVDKPLRVEKKGPRAPF